MTTKSGFLAEAHARGFVFQCTDEAELDAALSAGTVAGYIGFDPTGDSLHVGHMVQIMLLRLLQKHGHKPVARRRSVIPPSARKRGNC
jgi:tyrosyl-tRNA synthetase